MTSDKLKSPLEAPPLSSEWNLYNNVAGQSHIALHITFFCILHLPGVTTSPVAKNIIYCREGSILWFDHHSFEYEFLYSLINKFCHSVLLAHSASRKQCPPFLDG